MCLQTQAATPIAPPKARQAPVQDEYYGTQVIDPYRWMEETDSAELKTWMKAQSDYTRARLDAIAHPRGGGEFGEQWHRGGMKETKLNTVLDTIACAQYLFDAGYTVPSRLAVSGASAGGIVAGGALTWRPDLFAAVIDHAGISDALRTETTANGPSNVPEFGSTKTEAGFHALYAMSPYHHIRSGVAYPAVLLEAGVNDPRVDAWEMAKMAARLQTATSSERPILLRVDFDTGHFGGDKSQLEALIADEWSFLLWQLGNPAFAPAEQASEMVGRRNLDEARTD